MTASIIRKANHTGFTVSNLNTAAAFFRDVLGFTITAPVQQSGPAVERMTGMTGAKLTILFAYGGGHVVELMQYFEPPGRTTYELRPCDVGCAHIAFEVDDIDDINRRIQCAGYMPFSAPQVVPFGPRKGGKNLYVRGPDNIIIEFQEAPDGFVDPFV